jgi:hypothetical protein
MSSRKRKDIFLIRLIFIYYLMDKMYFIFLLLNKL